MTMVFLGRLPVDVWYQCCEVESYDSLVRMGFSIRIDGNVTEQVMDHTRMWRQATRPIHFLACAHTENTFASVLIVH